MKTFTVAFYEVDRAYGGAEEGGWWYDCGEFIRIARTFRTEDAAYRFARRANSLLATFQRSSRSVSSVLYRGGRHVAQVYDSLPPARYPEQTPHYE